ncbi:unnamed protein product [Mucor hiemalis]
MNKRVYYTTRYEYNVVNYLYKQRTSIYTSSETNTPEKHQGNTKNTRDTKETNTSKKHQRNTKGTPKEHQRNTKGTPKEHQRNTKGTPKEHQRNKYTRNKTNRYTRKSKMHWPLT